MRPRTSYSEQEFTALQDKVRGGVVRTRRESIGCEATTAQQADIAVAPGRKPREVEALPVRSMHEIGRAGSNPAPSPLYKSKWEAAYASKLDLEKRAGLIKAYWHEPFSLWLPGKIRYKPDFLVQYLYQGGPGLSLPLLELIEVKGWSRNRRDGMTRLKMAAALFQCFVWRLVYRTEGGGWDGEYL